MAQVLQKHKYAILNIVLLSLFLKSHSHQFATKMYQESTGLNNQTITNLHFYFHDITSGNRPTAIQVLAAVKTSNSLTQFGSAFMIDDPLTEGPELTSKIVGRAQGTYAFADLNEFALQMVLNYVFVEGEYNGSTLSILGRNSVLSPVRELPIVGGTGIFRFARGYAILNTYSINPSNGDAVVEYNVYVQHY